MGVGAAVIFPTTLGLITNIFTDPVPRAKAIGLWAAMVGVGVAVGPISGGWLLEHFWWGSIFMVNIPIAALAIVGGILFIPTSRDPAAPRVDVPGLVLSAAGSPRWSTRLSRRPTWGWTNGRTVAGFAVAAMVLAAFALWERRSTHPMLDVTVFLNRRFSGGSLAVTAGFLTLFGFIFVITQYFQFIKNYSAFEAGVRLLPVAGLDRGGQHSGTATGRTNRHHRRRRRWSRPCSRAGLAWASTVDAATPYSQIAMQMLLLGGGLGLTTAPATEAIMGSLSAGQGRDRLGRQRHHPRTGRHVRASPSWAVSSRRCTPGTSLQHRRLPGYRSMSERPCGAQWRWHTG